MDSGTLIGLVIIVLMIAAGAWVSIKIIQWIVNLVLSPFRKFKAWRLEKLEPAIQGIGGYIFIKCVHPLGQDIKGKKFSSIDFEALKEKYKLPGNADTTQLLNTIFFKEIDDVVKSIRDGETTNLPYINNSWIGSDYDLGVNCLSHRARDYIKSDANEESFATIKTLGEELGVIVKRARVEAMADDALNGEYEEEEEEASYETYESSDTYDDTDSYVAPVAVERNESRSQPQQRSKPKQHGFEIVRYYGSQPLVIGERLSQSSAIQLAQQKCNDRSQAAGAAFVVREKDSGATIWSGQRVK